MILNNFNNVKKNYQGRFISLRTHGWVGQAQQFFFSFFFLLQYAPLPKFFRTKSKLAGKKEGGLGGGIFVRLRPAKRDWGGKRLVFASAKKQSPQKLFPFRRIFCARSLKELIIFAGFVCCRQAASRWAGSAPVRAQTVARKRFELRSAIATKI